MNQKQQAFAREYLIDYNATQAAIRAGYSPKTAASQGERLLRNVDIRACIADGSKKLATASETEAEWVRRRLKEEADDVSEGASHSARIRALEILAKLNGMFELDNQQRADPLAEVLRGLSGNVFRPQAGDGDEGGSLV